MSGLRVALIGLGDIARKVYLPLLTAQPGVIPVLVTRDPTALRSAGDTYRVTERHTTLESALAAGIDAAFVHAATGAHPEIVGTLLGRDVPVFVDKPLADTYAVAAELAALAERRQVPLMVGFNRRYAPAYRELAGWPRRDVVLMQKHRRGHPEAPRRLVFDDFIHVVDTLRFLAPGPGAAMTVDAGVDAGLVRWVSVSLRSTGGLAVGMMSRESGLVEEVLEVIGPGRKRRVLNLSETVDYAGAESVQRRDGWEPVAVQRGFAPMCAEFLDAVRAGSALTARDALETHALCEQIVAQVGARG